VSTTSKVWVKTRASLTCIVATGEFSRTALGYEGSGAGSGWAAATEAVWEGVGRADRLLGSQSSVYSFTRSFRELASELTAEGDIESVAQALLSVDGGPHTLWWYAQCSSAV
jgi:hypothetical protein